jgi:hypothetical protein
MRSDMQGVGLAQRIRICVPYQRCQLSQGIRQDVTDEASIPSQSYS